MGGGPIHATPKREFITTHGIAIIIQQGVLPRSVTDSLLYTVPCRIGTGIAPVSGDHRVSFGQAGGMVEGVVKIIAVTQ